jgi:hypothetical protein
MIMNIIGSPKFDEAKLDGYAAVVAEIESPRYALMKLQDRLKEAEGEILRRKYEAVIAHIKSISSGIKTTNQKKVTESLIDIANPKTWEAAIDNAQGHIREVSAALISVAKDETRSNDDRRKAIFLLGRIEDKESLNFLVENMALYLQMEIVKGDDDTLKETPCAYALRKTRSWKVAQAVFASLEVTKSKRERVHFAGVLRATLGQNLALAAIEEQLHRTPRPITAQRRENLEAIREYLLE